jgi:hypothetical protein
VAAYRLQEDAALPTSSEPADIGALRTRIAARINAQHLPRAGEHKIFAGFGHNEICDACEKPVGSTDVLYEIEQAHEADGSSIVLAMHRWCFNLWIEESHQQRREGDMPMSESG